MIQVKIDIVAALKSAGYSTYRIRKENIFGQRVMTKFRNMELPSWNELDLVCELTGLDISDIVERVPNASAEVLPSDPSED